MQEENILLFEKYLEKSLNQTEVDNFENRLHNDSDFYTAFNDYKETVAFLKSKFENTEKNQAFKENLNTISNKYFDKEPINKKVVHFKPWHYSIAASILLLVGVYLFNNSSQPTYNDFISYEKISLTVRSGNSTKLNLAEKAFNSKDFKSANNYFSTLLKDDKDNTQYKLYKSFSLIELGQFTEADSILNNISKGNSIYKNKAKWYLALSKLKQKDYIPCLVVLKSISKSATEYTEAKKLINHLE